MKRRKLLKLLLIDSSSETENTFIYSKNWSRKIKKFSEAQYVENFRMKRACFEKLYENASKENPGYTNLDRDLHIFIKFVASDKTYRDVRENFGLPKSTINRIVEKISVLLYEIACKLIVFPEEDEMEELKVGFSDQNNQNENNVVLAIDGTHIEITKPKNFPFSYYNRHGYFSLNFVIVVDYKMRIRSAIYSFGSSHDLRVVRLSEIGGKIEEKLEGYKVAGDAAFSSINNVIVPGHLNNRRLDNLLRRQRIVVENAFALFKNKFKRFSSRITNGESSKNIKITYACFYLHNFIIENNK